MKLSLIISINTIQRRKDVLFCKCSLSKELDECSNRMKACGYTIIPTINKQGNIQGFNILDKSDTRVKLSEIDRKIKLTPEFFDLLRLKKRKAQKESESLEQKILRSQKRNFNLKM